MPQGCIYVSPHPCSGTVLERGSGTLPYVSHLRWPRRPSSSLTEEIEREIVLPHQLWTNLGVEGVRTISGVRGNLADCTRPDGSHASTENTVTVSAHLQPAFALQLGRGSLLQAGYQFSTDRP